MSETLTDFAAERQAMVERQIEGRGISDPKILEAFRAVPREEFLSDELRDIAYGDHPLPIEAGQTISQPYIVALMIKSAEVQCGDKVLEVGAGSGYAAALLGCIAGRVIAVERQPELASAARRRLERLGHDNVEIVEGDGTRGRPEDAPFDAIIIAASGSHVPDTLVEQLAPGGRLVMPVGGPDDIQKLVKVTIGPAGQRIVEDLGQVRFVPLIGEDGWDG